MSSPAIPASVHTARDIMYTRDCSRQLSSRLGSRCTTDKQNRWANIVFHRIRSYVTPFLVLLVALVRANSQVLAADGPAAARWIVVFKTHADKAKGLARRAGKFRHDYPIIPGFAADLAATEVDELRRDPSVVSVEPDAIRHTYQLAPTLAGSVLPTHRSQPQFRADRALRYRHGGRARRMAALRGPA